MKKVISIFIVTILLFSVGCSSTTTPEEIKLTDIDYKYIKCVYKYLSQWDIDKHDGSSIYNISKVGFYDYDYKGTISFFVSYPEIVSWSHGWKINISDNSMKSLKSESIYDYENTRIFDGWCAQNYMNGTDWDSSLPDKEKYNILIDAYKKFLAKQATKEN